MKIKVIELSNRVGRFVIDGSETPVIGATYELEDIDNPTARQNRAFHALLTEYWTSGMHSSASKNFNRFRDEVKVRLGAGFEKIVYADIVDGKALIVEVHRRDEIPSRILADPDLAMIVKAKPLSWADYTKKQRRETIDRLIAEMHQAGCNSRKFQEILEKMAEGKIDPKEGVK